MNMFIQLNSILFITHMSVYMYMYVIRFTGFYPSTFVDSRFPPKIQFLYCLLSSVALWSGPMVDTKGKMFKI